MAPQLLSVDLPFLFSTMSKEKMRFRLKIDNFYLKILPLGGFLPCFQKHQIQQQNGILFLDGKAFSNRGK